MFTRENTSGFSAADLALMNAALAQFISNRLTGDEVVDYELRPQLEKAGCDLINNNWSEGGNTIKSLLA